MSKLRGQLRFFLILAVGALAVYVFYNFVGRSGSSNVRTIKDSTVLKYHRLAGQVDVGMQFQDGQNSQEKHPVADSQENPPVADSQENGPHQQNSDEEIRQGKEGLHNIGEMERSDDTDDQRVVDDSNQDTQQHKSDEKVEYIDNREENGHKKRFSPFVSDPEEEEFDLYTENDPKFSHFFEKQYRLVHLDLKGAAPKLSYLEQVIPLFSDMGATGLLIEYEDMFPYDGHLSTLAAKNAYSKQDITKINAIAHKKGMTVIPLIPTFGHMEFVLKGSMYQNLREEEHIPQVISPTENSRLLIKAMIDQVHGLHPDAKFLHIGCDEVYRLGEGKSKHLLEEQGLNSEDLFFSHTKAVAKMVTDLGLQPIMWDDMFRKLDQETLMRSGIGEIVQPMVWQYIQQPQAKLPQDIWSKYGHVFGNVWIASSFKGATGSSQYVTDVSYHLENHLNWVEIMKFYGSDSGDEYVKFIGVALTGWQRYDHFATLCELLPVAIPSLAVCLQTLKRGYFDKDLHQKIAHDILHCNDLLKLNLLPEADKTSACEFPGSKIYYDAKQLYELKKDKVESYSIGHRLSGWMSSYNVKHNFSSPGQLEVFKKLVKNVRKPLLNVRERLQKSLLEVFDQYTTEEFLEVQIDSVVEKLDREVNLALSLAKRNDWPRRPLIRGESDDPVDTLNINNADQNQAGERKDFGGNKDQPSNQFLQQNINKAIPGGNAALEGLTNLNKRIGGNNQVLGGLVGNQLFKQPVEGNRVPLQGHQFPVQNIQPVQGHLQSVQGNQGNQVISNKLVGQGNQVPLQRNQFVQGIQRRIPVQGNQPVHNNQQPVPDDQLARRGNPLQGNVQGNNPVQSYPNNEPPVAQGIDSKDEKLVDDKNQERENLEKKDEKDDGMRNKEELKTEDNKNNVKNPGNDTVRDIEEKPRDEDQDNHQNDDQRAKDTGNNNNEENSQEANEDTKVKDNEDDDQTDKRKTME